MADRKALVLLGKVGVAFSTFSFFFAVGCLGLKKE